MIEKKICLLGDFAVGKTSLVRRFVHGTFSEKYLTTVGVKIDRKNITVGGDAVSLIVWDLAGDDGFCRVAKSYLRGAAGGLLVVDGTRRSTLARAIAIRRTLHEVVGEVPVHVLLNKVDIEASWEIGISDLEPLASTVPPVKTSALSGDGVENAFQVLAGAILERDGAR